MSAAPKAAADLPQGCIIGDFSLYHGMLHSHTQYSDGELIPEDAYLYARDTGDLDIFGLTDHLEQLYVPVDVEKWAQTMAVADDFYEPGSYVTLAGYEYGSAFDRDSRWRSFGHNNVFFTDELMPAIMLDYKLFYQKLVECETCLAQFNHPWEEEQVNWDDFKYSQGVDPQLNQIEMPADPVTDWSYLFQALDMGWHVSPTRNQDNHSADWGTKDDSRTGFWLTSLTREAVGDAMRNRRTFSTLDRNAGVALKTAEGCFMGSELLGVSSASLTLQAMDPDPGDGFERLELYGRGGTLMSTFDCQGATTCQSVVGISAPSGLSYYLFRAVQTDGQVLISAPLWFRR